MHSLLLLLLTTEIRKCVNQIQLSQSEIRARFNGRKIAYIDSMTFHIDIFLISG